MATRIRLRRLGAKKRPFYRVVVADQRAPRDGRFIENIGKYHPLEDPSLIEIDEDRALHWLRVGAQPSSQVRNLMVKTGIWDRFVQERPSAADLVRARTEKPAGGKLSKKAAAKAAADAEAPAPAAAETVAVEPVAPEPAAEAVASEPAADYAPELDAAADASQAGETSDGGAGSASGSDAPSEEPGAEASPDVSAEENPAREETTEA